MPIHRSPLARTAALLLCASSAWATGLGSLEAFVKNVKTGRSEFTQTVTAPSKDGQAPRTKISNGTFEFARPLHFRFVYKKPFEQTIVADGQTLWLFDADLNQVTARKQSSVLASTPAALIAAATDLKSLQADFTLSAAPDKDGLEWVLALPKAKDNAVQSVSIGFKAGDLAALDIVDSFGQHSRLAFNAFQANIPLAPSTFQFKPPAGADVIKQ